MKTSLVIPATNGNFNYLKCILSHYQDGTVKPDQVVISLSNSHLVDQKLICQLKERFEGVFEDYKLLEHTSTLVQGPNRDAGTMACDNEIIISNDADDIPHPQRIEVIKHFFENKQILHLNHSYQTRNDMTFEKINLDEVICLEPEETFKLHYRSGDVSDPNISPRPDPRRFGYPFDAYGAVPLWGGHCATMCGAPAFHKDVFKTLRWRHTEEWTWDWDFCVDVLYRFRKSVLINSKLMWYNLLPVKTRRDNANPKHLGLLFKE